MADEAELQDEPVPTIITDDYMKVVLTQTDEFVKNLRSQENYQLANQVIKLVTISENLQFQLKNEQQKIEDILEKFVDAGGRIEKAIKISQRDHDVIKKLKDEVISAWKSTDIAKLREQHTHESLNQTRTKYLALLEQNKKMTVKFEDSDELGDNAATVLQECDRLSTEIAEYKKRLFVQRAYSEELQKKLEASHEKNQELFHQWDTATNESLSNRRKVETLTVTVSEMKEQLETTSDDMTHFKQQSEALHKRLKNREQQIKDMVENLDKIKVENSILSTAKSKLDLNLKSLKSEMSTLRQEATQYQNYIRLKEDESKKLFLENEKEVKRSENLQRKIASLEKVVSKNDLELANKKTEIHTAEKEIDLLKKSSDDLKRENDKLLKKIEHQMSEIEKLNASIQDLKQERQSILEEKAYISSDLKSCRESEKKAKSNMKKLQSNLEVVESEKLFLSETLKNLNEDFEAKKKLLEKNKQELSEAQEQIAHFKHEYSTALKNLKDTRADLQRCIEREADIKDRMVKCKSQVEDTNEKLATKIEEVVTLTKRIQKLEKTNRETKRDLERSQDSLRETRVEAQDLRHESKIQKDELRENDTRFVRMKGQMDKMLRERDLLANQMFRKTDENGILEQKVSTLKMSLDRGDSMYQKRIEDIKIMKNEVQGLHSQNNVLKRGLENTFDLRHETLQLYRKLNQEKVKVKVLEEEMLTPMNVHRWRKLGCKDPDRMTLIRKCHRYQKHSFRQMLKLSRYEGTIKEMEKKNLKLQNELERYSKVQIQEKLVETKSLAQLYFFAQLTDHVIIGTPGKVLDWSLKYRAFDLQKITVFVLDEADVMIAQQGHQDQCIRLHKHLSKKCQMMLFSATYEKKVMEFAEYIVLSPITIRLKKEDEVLDNIKQYFVKCPTQELKYQAIANIYGVITIGQAIIFCHTRKTAGWLSAKMCQEGHSVGVLSGELNVEQRLAVLDRFRESHEKVLITTNVLSRGIDIEQVNLVVNFDLPIDQSGKADCETYLHRIGRTGRFGKHGIAINLIDSENSMHICKDIERHFGKKIMPLDVENSDEIEKIGK